ncbi:hypothetical protein QAD02_014023 [Eretmocerus hayati]|uniref:Uncharacterized protein n=1 Tax=Eretmocerus hayati TaxID=131215 RepID=A0ACC2P5V7_9HYME|nr:hypothetical protein QAD02_014023 [Eretmocerus hayati]
MKIVNDALKTELSKEIDDVGARMGILERNQEDVQNRSVRYSRMGKRTNEKSRPVELVLNDSEGAMWVLIHQKEFCKDDVYCGNDKTPQQQEHLASLKAGLNERKKKGETKLIIKYLKGTPTIVEKIVTETGQVEYQQ